MNKQFLTIDQFAEQMQISRSTAYGWIAEGRLGPYLLRIKSVVRIAWSDDLLIHLLTSSDKPDITAVAPLRRKGRGGRGKVAFDMSSLG
jgi:excisionase family DNA binding protein